MSSMLFKSRVPTDTEMEQIFRAFDRNQDGYLEQYDVGAILIKLGERPEPSDVVLASMSCNLDGKKRLNLQDFKTWFKKISAHHHGEYLNRLLLHDRLAMSKRSSYHLPQQTFVYGKPSGYDRESAGEVISSWDVFHHDDTDRYLIPDFVPMNINASDENCVYAPEYRAHHLSHMIFKTDPTIIAPNHGPSIPEGVRGSRFGYKNVPSTPAGMLIKSQWDHCKGDDPDYPQIPRFSKPKEIPFARQTRASRSIYTATQSLLQSRQPSSPLWKMPKFGNVASRTDDHWAPPTPFKRFDELESKVCADDELSVTASLTHH